MVGVVPVVGSHVPGQPLNVFGSFAGISRFQPGTFLARQENILKLSISAARTLYSFGLTMFFIFLRRGLSADLSFHAVIAERVVRRGYHTAMNAVIRQSFQDFEAIAGMNDVKLYGGVPPCSFH